MKAIEITLPRRGPLEATHATVHILDFVLLKLTGQPLKRTPQQSRGGPYKIRLEPEIVQRLKESDAVELINQMRNHPMWPKANQGFVEAIQANIDMIMTSINNDSTADSSAEK